MARDSKATIETAMGPEMAKEINSLWSHSLSQGAQIGSAEMMESMRTLSRDMMGFLEDRMRKNMETARAMTEAKTPSDLARLNMEYFRGFMADYNRQLVHMAEETGRTFSSTLHKTQPKS